MFNKILITRKYSWVFYVSRASIVIGVGLLAYSSWLFDQTNSLDALIYGFPGLVIFGIGCYLKLSTGDFSFQEDTPKKAVNESEDVLDSEFIN